MTTITPPAGPSELPFRLSVLERGGHFPEATGEEALQDVVEVAMTAERYGYDRVWIAEHHSAQRSASSFPAVTIAHIATRTQRIRVGSGGVMLPNHPPIAVAEQFATLQALHPGRIDLGVGRSSGGTTTAHRRLEAALRRDPQAATRFPGLIDELLGFLHHRGPEQHRFHALPLTPHVAEPPQVYVLGAGEGSARAAAERGLPFVYGHHLSRTICRPEAAARYRTAFEPGPQGARPYLIVSVQVVCAETDEKAAALALENAAYLVGHPVDSIADVPLSPVREEYLARRALEEYQVVHGAPATVAAELGRLADELGADEFMLVPYELSGAARCRTLRLAAGIRQGRPREAARR
ncbi:MsnO8 family LLM class oxidoreductase [Actinacidiphila acididurans]|uniref:MsnO8 family LLM class oxidoreductase n=1 Tax=Actinacidiphila acididurans TaxID=2784346 RepID=A0ABS2U2Y3_9ACTN|nr:MsnO8 family LLM class oxidoreductase [Actinacidiphila acididurans]MBM9508895.1 MsnO8 family LLM class oxidoreductase [Actinacidiphila acididurans]